MRKVFTSCARHLSAFLMLIAMVCIATGSAGAVEPINLGELEIGKTYTVPGRMADVIATLTAPATGTLTVNSGGMRIYSDPEHQNELNANWSDYYTNGGIYSLEISEGATYYFYKSAVNAWTTDQEMTLYMDGYSGELPLEFLTVSPAPGEVYALTGETPFIRANQPVTADATARLIYAGTSAEGISIPNAVRIIDTYVYIDIKSMLKSEIQSGNLNHGDEIKIGVKDIKTKNGNLHPDATADGWYYITYKCGSIPVNCLTQKIPATFKSYWVEGDPDGVIELTFDAELGMSEGTLLMLGYGDKGGGSKAAEGGTYYYEPISATVNGNKISFDLTGKVRTPISMLPLFGTTYPTMAVDIFGVVDQYGNPVASEGHGTVGSYSYVLPYEYIERANIASEFIPSNGSSLKGVNEIEVWISNINSFSFTGFDFSYNENKTPFTVNVPKENARVEIDGNDATYLVDVPASVKDKSGVTVTLSGLKTKDGFDHSNDVRAVYDAFVLTYVDPANGAEMAQLTEGTVITVRSNYSDTYPEMYMEYDIKDLDAADPNEAIIKSQSWLNRLDDGSYVAEVYGNYKMILGHRYQVNFTAWATEMDRNYMYEPIGEASVIWNGLTPPFRFSDILLESITPQPSENLVLTKNDRNFVLKFNGLVRLDQETTFVNTGMGSSMPFAAIVPEEPVEDSGYTYANTWTLSLSESFMNSLKSQLTLSVKAYDMDGLLVEGNDGYEDQSYFCFIYNTEGQFHDFEVFLMNEYYEPVEVPDKLSSVYVFCEDGIDISYQYALDACVLVDKFGVEVAHVESVIKEEYYEGSSQLNTMLGLVLNQTITEGGSYMMYFPANYFAIGSEFDAYLSVAKRFPIEVGGVLTTTISPNPGNVKELSTFDINFSIPVMETEMTGNPYLALPDGSTIEITDIDLHLPVGELWTSLMTLTLPESITEFGEYSLVIPAQYFYVKGTNLYSEEFVYNYRVTDEAPAANITINPVPGEIESLSVIEITFDDYSEVGVNSGVPTLSIDGGDPVRLNDVELDWDIWNKCMLNLGQTYTAAGTYVITFPAGYFLLGEDGDLSDELSLTYTIVAGDIPQPDDVIVFNPAEGDVEELSSITIKYVNEEEIGIGAGKATLSIDGGEDMYLPDLTFDFDADLNELIQPLGETYTADGTYVITFPAGYFLLGSNGRNSAEVTVTYTIFHGSVSIVTADANGIYHVFAINGVKVLETENISDVKSLAPGIYIINGVKIVVK